MKKILRFTEIYYDDAERLAVYLASRDNEEVMAERCSSEFFPAPPQKKVLPDMVNCLSVGNYRIAYLEKRENNEQDRKHRNRNLHRVMMGERLREARESAGMTLEDVERITDFKAKNIQNIEDGRYDASIDILGNICDAIGCHLDFVFDSKY